MIGNYDASKSVRSHLAEVVLMALATIPTLARYSASPFFIVFTPLGRLLVSGFSARRLHPVHSRMASSLSSSHGVEVSESGKQQRLTAPFGSWKSPITSDIVSGASKRLGGLSLAGDGRLLWVESRPAESGRAVLVKEPEKPGDEPIDITPKEFSVRTTCQEYGGGAFSCFGDAVVFSNYKDQRLYKQSVSSRVSSPVPITPDYGGPLVCYADGVFDFRFNRYITVREDRRKDSMNPATEIVTVALSNDDIQEPKVLIGGCDFYAFPRIDPRGERIAWIQWSLPNMPWDRAELWVGYISENGDLYNHICVAGSDPNIVEAATEPKWSSRGELFFITDRQNGFWNIYKWIESENKVMPVYPLNAEFARPLWVFGMNSYEIKSYDDKNLIICSYRQNGRSNIGILDDSQNSLSLLEVPFTDIQDIALGNDVLYVEGASGVLPSSVAKVTLESEKLKVLDFHVVWSSSPDVLKYKPYFSLPELIEFPTKVPGENAYAYFYPPLNPLYQALEGEKPPLLLKSHGGPTAEARGMLNLSIQFWTSRGWAFVDVNYGGSTGYGREFRERLLGRWGIVDVDDCCSCAQFLVESGKADGNRLCITGGSAGGYTTLASLAFRDVFKAGASLYGVADLNLLRAETHKFESRYIDKLVENEKDYYERSPLNFIEKFSCPIILFQGLEDKVVPPEQARKIYRALKEKGLPVALVEYEGEQHGFRKAENIKFTLEQQMLFFARLIGKFQVADEITAIKIDNFD
ncbi:hypothetical protein SAY86_016388 [Trapa natans]|uniref:Peptidase S9 prolyl oligopeptidase catalytic domain-containing protein n=1 Tax=Trapa natans TaxID=22666 RepID=A0AAN7LK51_TRANT|nr:hypothetical protein SAY86_016388 [Trapa natans]